MQTSLFPCISVITYNYYFPKLQHIFFKSTSLHYISPGWFLADVSCPWALTLSAYCFCTFESWDWGLSMQASKFPFFFSFFFCLSPFLLLIRWGYWLSYLQLVCFLMHLKALQEVDMEQWPCLVTFCRWHFLTECFACWVSETQDLKIVQGFCSFVVLPGVPGFWLVLNACFIMKVHYSLSALIVPVLIPYIVMFLVRNPRDTNGT